MSKSGSVGRTAIGSRCIITSSFLFGDGDVECESGRLADLMERAIPTTLQLRLEHIEDSQPCHAQEDLQYTIQGSEDHGQFTQCLYVYPFR